MDIKKWMAETFEKFNHSQRRYLDPLSASETNIYYNLYRALIPNILSSYKGPSIRPSRDEKRAVVHQLQARLKKEVCKEAYIKHDTLDIYWLMLPHIHCIIPIENISTKFLNHFISTSKKAHKKYSAFFKRYVRILKKYEHELNTIHIKIIKQHAIRQHLDVDSFVHLFYAHKAFLFLSTQQEELCCNHKRFVQSLKKEVPFEPALMYPGADYDYYYHFKNFKLFYDAHWNIILNNLNILSDCPRFANHFYSIATLHKLDDYISTLHPEAEKLRKEYAKIKEQKDLQFSAIQALADDILKHEGFSYSFKKNPGPQYLLIITGKNHQRHLIYNIKISNAQKAKKILLQALNDIKLFDAIDSAAVIDDDKYIPYLF